MIKLSNGKEKPSITEKEKAQFVLEQSLQTIEESIKRTEAKITKLDEDIKTLLKMGSKKNAVTILSQKKKLTTLWEKLFNQRSILEEQVLNLESNEIDWVLLDVMVVATNANKTMKQDLAKYEDLMEKIDEQKSA